MHHFTDINSESHTKGGNTLFLKKHVPDQYIQYLLAIDNRTMLLKKDFNNLKYYKMGFEGELNFYNKIKHLNNLYIIWDLTINLKGEAQYDFIFIANNKIIHIDVKNYTGLYAFENGNFISQQGYVHQGLISQLDRAHRKLELFVNQHRLNYKVISKILFINPSVNFNQIITDKRIITHKDVPNLVQDLSNFSTNEMDKIVSELLLKLNISEESERIHYYPYDQLIKGVRCKQCNGIGLFKQHSQRTLRCLCGHSMSKHDYISQAIQDISILKNMAFSTNELFEYTNIHRSTLKRHLKKHCYKLGTHRNALYYLKNE